ncbi:ribose 5-phosphate isomerase B [Alistipes sp. OttesenSCG-928-B03]|nr:ribose 5-phosphate isomerase B [Alistipes sp. OttesenSCG-928-B03]
MKEKIGIASDHAGYQMKEFVVGYLDGLGYDVHDFGPYDEESVDYPDYAHPLAFAIEEGELPRGIALCGSGNGISMALNKHQGIRAALCWTPELAELSRLHNNANVCSLPARFIDNTEAAAIVDKFLATQFEGGRHERRVEKIAIDTWLATQKK